MNINTFLSLLFYALSLPNISGQSNTDLPIPPNKWAFGIELEMSQAQVKNFKSSDLHFNNNPNTNFGGTFIIDYAVNRILHLNIGFNSYWYAEIN